ncbi:MAG: universal stress protein [Rhodocyclaceae bacterium]
MYKHLLVPVDGSPLSAHAASKAVAFAQSLSARITFLHVQPDYPLPIVGEGALIAPESRDDFQRDTREMADMILGKVRAEAVAAGLIAETHTDISDTPWQMIIDTANKAGCDLIFMASHGRRGLAGLLIGSETHKVLTHTTIPVLVYREA